MPYYYDRVEEPKSGEDGWDEFEEIWSTIKHDLLSVVFESKEQALEEKFRPKTDEDGYRFFDWRLVRFRKSDDREQLLYYHELGLEALEKTEKAINQRRLTAQFTYDWGMLTACHGYVMCAALANANDLSSERAGAAGRAATNLDMHKIWFSHYCLRLKDEKKLSRSQIEQAMARLINAIIDGDKPEYEALDVAWFERFLNLEDSPAKNENYGSLIDSFGKNLSFKKMRELIGREAPDLPPLDLKVPNP